MFWGTRHKVNRWGAGLNVLAMLVVSSCCAILVDWRIGLGVLAAWLLLLDGGWSIYYLVREKQIGRTHRDADRQFVGTTMKDSENNPTIR